MACQQQRHQVVVSVEYPERRFAEIVCASLDVDKELRGSVVSRVLGVAADQPATLTATFESSDAKALRTSVSTFFDMLAVANDAINNFAS
jgi:tRNA threonylcarbamoyladenosine modification (KEOPS) complex  Pcc1 subunit